MAIPRNILRDGTVVPSFLSVDRGLEASKIPGQKDFALKTGTITKVHYPDQSTNIRKIGIEYDVQVQERDGNKGPSIHPYPNCMVVDLFGGAADSFEWTFRPAPTENVSSQDFTLGSSVFLLCLQGDANCAVIIAGHPNSSRSLVSTSTRGHFLEFEFNGVNVEINDDGELTATYRSKTDIQGVPQDEVSGGTYIKIDKTGSVEVHANDATWVKVDKPANDIFMNADNAIREIANGNFVANAPKIKIGGDEADQPLVLGNLFMALYNAMVSKFNSHTHSGVSTGLSSTGKPSAQAAKMTSAQLSDFVSTKKSYKKEE